MTSRYRVEYALKIHKRDELIEWIKALLAVPFVLHGETDEYEKFVLKKNALEDNTIELYERKVQKTLLTRYTEVFHDVEQLVDNTIALDKLHVEPGTLPKTRLRLLVPSVGLFFTRLPLKEAFEIEDRRRLISRRTLVSPSFNDVRSILNTAQVLALTSHAADENQLRLITFDGDVTLYDDGQNLTDDLPLVDCLVRLLAQGLYVAVVTAAGYPGQQGADSYQGRLQGLIRTFQTTGRILDAQKENFLVMGGESNYLFRYNAAKGGLQFIEGSEWYLPLMQAWDQRKINEVMEMSHTHLQHLRKKMRLDDDTKTTIIRKERSLGIIPVNGYKILRETLEEMVLLVLLELNEFLNHNKPQSMRLTDLRFEQQAALVTHTSDADGVIKVCAFNGGLDVWVDIGDKALGVEALQQYLHKTCNGKHGEITKSCSLHIGDQFASVGANDFKARLSACTVWIASPRETQEILQELLGLMEQRRRER